MSLEAAILENTAVLKQVAALLAESNKGRAEALAALPKPADAKPAATKPGKDKKGETETAPAKPAETKGAITIDGINKEFGSKITEEHIRKEFGDYMAVTDPKERDARKANVKAIVDELGAKKATEIEADDRSVAIYWLRKFVAGEKVDFKADDPRGDAKGGDGDDLL